MLARLITTLCIATIAISVNYLSPGGPFYQINDFYRDSNLDNSKNNGDTTKSINIFVEEPTQLIKHLTQTGQLVGDLHSEINAFENQAAKDNHTIKEYQNINANCTAELARVTFELGNATRTKNIKRNNIDKAWQYRTKNLLGDVSVCEDKLCTLEKTVASQNNTIVEYRNINANCTGELARVTSELGNTTTKNIKRNNIDKAWQYRTKNLLGNISVCEDKLCTLKKTMASKNNTIVECWNMNANCTVALANMTSKLYNETVQNIKRNNIKETSQNRTKDSNDRVHEADRITISTFWSSILCGVVLVVVVFAIMYSVRMYWDTRSCTAIEINDGNDDILSLIDALKTCSISTHSRWSRSKASIKEILDDAVNTIRHCCCCCCCCCSRNVAERVFIQLQQLMQQQHQHHEQQQQQQQQHQQQQQQHQQHQQHRQQQQHHHHQQQHRQLLQQQHQNHQQHLQQQQQQQNQHQHCQQNQQNQHLQQQHQQLQQQQQQLQQQLHQQQQQLYQQQQQQHQQPQPQLQQQQPQEPLYVGGDDFGNDYQNNNEQTSPHSTSSSSSSSSAQPSSIATSHSSWSPTPSDEEADSIRKNAKNEAQKKWRKNQSESQKAARNTKRRDKRNERNGSQPRINND